MDYGGRELAITLTITIVVWATFIGIYAYNLFSSGPTFDMAWYFLEENPEGGTLAYPLGAMAYFAFIRSFAGTPESFTVAFHALSLAWLGLLFFIYGKMMRIERLLMVSIIFAILIYFVIDRVEIVAVALAFSGAYLFSEGKRMGGWLAAIAGAFVKVFPVFLLPLFAIPEWGKKGGAKRVGIAGAVCVLLLLASPATINSLMYQSQRGLQVESVYSSVLLAANQFLDMGIRTQESWGSVHLVLPEGLQWLVPASTLLQAAAVGAVILAYALDKRRGSRFWEYCFLVLAVGVLFGKIGSTQFMLWPVAFAVPLIGKGDMRLYAMCIALAVFAILVFPYGWYSLYMMETLPIAVLAARNLVLAGMVAHVGLRLNEKGMEKAEHVARPDL
ncbi:MAG: hypothetical protein PHQ80_03765 [Candidatus ainarchaeum sp.]|nr:hypothetical protein [Candidatus ainarchaeum sp.]MDD5096225.1 hypothetical protein [Candidatus ainarchaeum sp.]